MGTVRAKAHVQGKDYINPAQQPIFDEIDRMVGRLSNGQDIENKVISASNLTTSKSNSGRHALCNASDVKSGMNFKQSTYWAS